LKDGYIIKDLNPQALEWVMEARLISRQFFGQLETYHERATDVIGDLTEAREQTKHYPRAIVHAELPFFQSIVGPDLHIQSLPYLRVSRPGIADDNIGLHRDTWYGDSPYELSVWIPLTDTDIGNALLVAPGSHIWPEEELENRKKQADKGSVKHSLGFMYAPKELRRPVNLKPLTVKVGQMIVFSLSLLHGQEVNRSTRTRVSMDVRVANSLAPIQWERSKANYYQPLSVSPLREQALKYYEAQK
jgi:sporadic carbohydrate cluster 2OG-Fe(II) oxygenase